MVRRGLAVCSLLAGLSLPACHTRTVGPDGGRDAPAGDAATSDVPSALALDISVTGCAHVDAGRADGGAAACTGTAPLTLTFAPVGSPVLTRFRWTFGDLTPPSTERAPTHTYLLPGIYDVGVVGEGAVGSVSRQRTGFVAVTADGAGTPCDIDAQCGGGLFCLCGEAAPCGDGFSHGVCTSACAASGCGAGAACARVVVPPRAAATLPDAGSDAPDAGDAGDTPDTSTVADTGAPFDAAGGPGDAAGTADAGAASLCLATCADDGDCSAGLVCRALPGVAGPGSWANVCVPPFFRRAGDSCRDARGNLDDRACATNLCADLGALGLCSATCAGGAACPPGTSCAQFGDGRSLCLTTCSTSAPCESDPLLACETGTGAGPLGFVSSTPALTATFCAPRSCSSIADCAPSGTCKPLGVGAHCVAN